MNKQELENEEVRQEEKKAKKKKVRKKKTMLGHIRSIISILLVVGIIGGSYWYYAFQYRTEMEPETNRKVTNTDSVYTMEQYLKTLKRNQTVYKYACDEAEVDNYYGTYVVPGLKSTRTLKVKGDGEAEVCTSMTPQGLAITEDYILVSAYCKTKAHDSVIYVIDKESRRFVLFRSVPPGRRQMRSRCPIWRTIPLMMGIIRLNSICLTIFTRSSGHHL